MSTHCIQHENDYRIHWGHFADDIFKCIFLNKNVWISINISLKFVPMGPIDHIPALVQIMAWRRPGDKPLSEPMMISLLTHICVTRPQWVKHISFARFWVAIIQRWSPLAGNRKFKLPQRFYKFLLNMRICEHINNIVDMFPDSHIQQKYTSFNYKQDTFVSKFIHLRLKPHLSETNELTHPSTCIYISMTALWARWRLKSPGSRWFTQSFVQAQIKENTKAPRYWPLRGEITGDRWIPRTKGQ